MVIAQVNITQNHTIMAVTRLWRNAKSPILLKKLEQAEVGQSPTFLPHAIASEG
ncbi:hypothetical protein HDE69_001943 [Pedobacter cryoconitis]|uniref:Uncharacterized protein n=1 Tax=Pedobacter cryoconitis TaxID=188932 RepID=A0A7W9DK66_9SPHI|nr:hypothetical protein [Pedobacter cryoconitis]